MRTSPRARRLDAVLIGAVALALRLAVVAWARGLFPAAEDGHYYDVLAQRLASGAGYTWAWPDGAVTYAALYPVGYPALLALAHLVLGPSVLAAMTANAVLGAAGAYGMHRLVDGEGVARWRPFAAGLAIALHPALVPYTAAVMTEGVTASLLIVAAALVARARRGTRADRARVLGAGLCMGIVTLVRPQSLVLAPVLGALGAPASAGLRARLVRSVALTAVALACVAPWTARNCVRMHRCALVSVNGGWNLLIGATTDTGAWQPIAVPAECGTTWDEAGKDACFERVAWREIARAPAAWLGRAPAKLRVTLDYFGAAPWYLHSSNPQAFGDRAKLALGAVETAVCRLFLLAALVACGRLDGARALARKLVALGGAVAAVSTQGWLAYVAVVVCVALAGGRAAARGPALAPLTAAVIATTVCVHAVFFGAGRYGLLVAPFVAALAFVGPAPPRAG